MSYVTSSLALRCAIFTLTEAHKPPWQSLEHGCNSSLGTVVLLVISTLAAQQHEVKFEHIYNFVFLYKLQL